MSQVINKTLGHRNVSVALFTLATFLLIQLATTSRAASSEISLSAALNTTGFSMDSAAILTVEVQGARGAEINIPQVENIQFQSRGQSTQIQMINGDFSAATTNRFLVQALKPGKYTIPPIEVVASGETLKTTPIDFEVTPAGVAPQPGKATPGRSVPQVGKGVDQELAFLRITKVQKKSYTGEVIPIQIKAYFKQGIRAQLNSQPALKADGFVMPRTENDPQQTVEKVNNQAYSVITWNSSVTAIKEGKHTLKLEMEATILFPQRSRRSSPFNNRGFFQDDFFDDFFGSYQQRDVKLASKEITIEALPLPTKGKPKNFSGAIGNFSLDVHAAPTKVDVGDPITLKMTISGTGNFDRVSSPKFPETPDWKTYSPSSEFQSEGASYKGRKIFEQAIVLKNGKIKEIPPISFVYFDTDQEKYKELNAAAIPLKIKGSVPTQVQIPTATPAPTAVAENEEPPSTLKVEGLAPLQLESGRTYSAIRPIFQRSWYLAIVVFCLIFLLTSLFVTMRRQYHSKNPEILKKKRLENILSANLQKLEEESVTGNSASFLATCRKAIQEQLGQIWDREPSAITLDYVRQKLTTGSPLITLFEAAEQSAYGDFHLTQEEMEEYQKTLKKELGEIQ